jgi:hypothetical protein
MNNFQMKMHASLALVVAVLALAGSALAGARPDDRAGLHGIGATSSPTQVRPDDRAGVRGVGSTGLVGSVRPDDRAGIRGTGGTSYAAPVATSRAEVASDRFDWSSAGVGAAGAFALTMLLTGGVFSLRRIHRRPHVAA